MPTGALRREKIPPSTPVTITASADAWRIASAPTSTRSPMSTLGAGRIASRALVSSRASNHVTTASSPTVPSTTSPRTTISGTGSCKRSTGRMSASVSSGSHSAPSGEATDASSGMDRLPAREGEIAKLAWRDHPDAPLILVGHDREPALLLRHECDDLAEALMFVDEQRGRTQQVARLYRGRRRSYREIAPGHHDVARDQPVDDVLLGDVAHRPAVDE